ncbi:MAG: glycoside hydrolase family 172 protein [Clostridia bacterium]
MDSIYLHKDFKAKRVSSYDVTGGNTDSWTIPPGETRTLADISGPGMIHHIWFTIFGRWGKEDDRPFDPLTLRNVLIRMYWDGEKEPSVECPVGDFFGLGHGRAYTYQCAAFSTSCNEPIEGDINSRVAMNCWLPMPFHQNARIEITNEQDISIIAYFYIDYREYRELPEGSLHLHASWKRENPCTAVKGDGKNLSDKENYVILEAEGKGHYIGTNMSIDNQDGGWWGEGDDMIFIDREEKDPWPPDLHGTGSEDYLCHAWGMQKVSHLYDGQSWCEVSGEGNEHHNRGKVCVYRYHIADPVPFTKKIRVSIEHGHANDRGDDIASVAYWYQNEPHKPFAAMLPRDQRVPRE